MATNPTENEQTLDMLKWIIPVITILVIIIYIMIVVIVIIHGKGERQERITLHPGSGIYNIPIYEEITDDPLWPTNIKLDSYQSSY